MKPRVLYLGLSGLLVAGLMCSDPIRGASPALGAQVHDSQKPLQHSVASKTAKFRSVSKTDEIYASAIDAHDLAGAYKKVGQTGAFKGTVSKIFEERDGDLMILNFDPDYKTALTAVLKNPEFPKFPDMKALEGKEIVVSGSFVDYHGKAEILLADPEQIKVVR
jgi:hypothetical protein